MTDSNPYEPPSATGALERETQLGQKDSRCVSPWRYGLAFFAIVVFLTFGYGFIREMVDRNDMRAAIYATVSVAAIPFAVTDARLLNCFTGSLLVPFATLGASAAYAGYFAMFALDWFNDIFNNKGGGDFGLMVSVFTGFTLGGLVGWFVIALTPLPTHRRLKDYLGPQDGG